MPIFLFFSLIASSAFCQKAERIRVPSFMQGVEKDESQPGNFYEYQGGVYVGKDVAKLDGGKVESFVKRLWEIYREGDKASFKKLFNKEGLKSLEGLGDKTFEREWKTLRSQKNARLNFYFTYEGGHVVSWNVGEIPRGIFLVPEKDKLKIGNLVTKPEDIEFQNRSMYFTRNPRPVKVAEIVSPFSLEDKDYRLKARVEPSTPYLHIFKKEGEKWIPKVVLKDNSKGKVRFDDLDPEEGMVSVKFKREHFTKGKKHELLVLQSNFPMSFYPIELMPVGNLTP